VAFVTKTSSMTSLAIFSCGCQGNVKISIKEKCMIMSTLFSGTVQSQMALSLARDNETSVREWILLFS
jgi:hypothetical protein